MKIDWKNRSMSILGKSHLAPTSSPAYLHSRVVSFVPKPKLAQTNIQFDLSGQCQVQHWPRELKTSTLNNFYLRATVRHAPWVSANQEAGNCTNLLRISSKYGVDTTWNMADYAGNITAQVRCAFEPEMWVEHELLSNDSSPWPVCWQPTPGPKWTQPKRFR